MPEIETHNYENFFPQDLDKDNNSSNSNEIMIESTPLENIDDLETPDLVVQDDTMEEALDQTNQQNSMEEETASQKSTRKTQD